MISTWKVGISLAGLLIVSTPGAVRAEIVRPSRQEVRACVQEYIRQFPREERTQELRSALRKTCRWQLSFYVGDLCAGHQFPFTADQVAEGLGERPDPGFQACLDSGQVEAEIGSVPPGVEGAPVTLSLTGDEGADPNLVRMQSLSRALRVTFTSPNQRGLTFTQFPGDLIFGIRRRLGFLSSRTPIDQLSPQELFDIGWAAASSPIGQPRANCGELAAATHAFIIWDRLTGRNSLGGVVTRWRIIVEQNRDHAWALVEAGGRWYQVDPWFGTAAAIAVDGNLMPVGVPAQATPVYFFR